MPSLVCKKPRLLGKVSSDVAHLDKLQPLYPWLPTSATVRPSEAGKTAKRARLQQVETDYDSFSAYILVSVFGRASVRRAGGVGKIECVEPSVGDGQDAEMRFLPNEFPYDIDAASGGRHWVLWYAAALQPKADDDISRDIHALLRTQLGDDCFDFAWYQNPKMTVPEFYHVQVFWVQLP